MPRGSAPGERRGGKVKGSKNRATIEKERIAAEIAARTVMDARVGGKKLGKEVLEDFMHLFAGMAAVYQPTAPGKMPEPGRTPDPVEFEKWAKYAVDAASRLAKYQSPTFQAVAVHMSPGDIGGQNPAPEQIEAKANGPHEAGKAYLRMVKGGKAA